ncbi:MAG: hypothetical protein QM811_28635 [Pirellulales bacterium]
MIEVRTTRNSAGTQLRQSTVLNSRFGYVVEQNLYAMNGQRIASAFLSEQRTDVVSGATMPHKVVLEWPGAKMKLTVEMLDFQINTINSQQQAGLFQMPSYDGFPKIDLASPGLQFGPAPTGGNMMVTPPPGTAQFEGAPSAQPSNGQPMNGAPANGTPQNPNDRYVQPTQPGVRPAAAWNTTVGGAAAAPNVAHAVHQQPATWTTQPPGYGPPITGTPPQGQSQVPYMANPTLDISPSPR